MPFTLVQEQTIPEIASTARLYRHTQTGARFLSLTNTDENKVFAVTFRTPPATSNGIAHIMEHSVLCGSRKYPAKDPFIELAKGSLSTFLNAFTYPDKTCYPVASANLQDLYNLADVYLDAVFYPLIPEHTLQQEGWRYEVETAEDGTPRLVYQGIVFNEMKGNYSSPDSLINYEYSQRSLFPNHTYGLDSGGDPAVIPSLTYQEFTDFHRQYYHPSNAYFYWYGDDDETKRLEYLDQWLDAFTPIDPASQIPLLPQWDSPRRFVYTYDSGETPDPKAYLTLNWLLPQAGHRDTLGLSILSHILTATPASPLRKAIMDSGLGEDLAGAGFEEGLRQMFYSTGIKGVAPQNLAAAEELILNTLQNLAQTGFDPETVAASLNTVEFRLREQNTGRFPRGLSLMLQALSLWLYDLNPLEALAFEQPLNEIKRKLEAGEAYFENLIRTHLLNNPHRSTVHLLPDPEEGARRAADEAARLQQIQATLTPEALQAIATAAEELKQRQNTPDTPETLASIPSLKLSDLDPHAKSIPLAQETLAETPLFFHDLATNGIVYFDLGLNLRALPATLLPYAGILGRVLLQMGTRTQNFVQLTQRIGKSTGGIAPTLFTAQHVDGQNSAQWLFLRGKAIANQTPDLLDILADVLLTVDLNQPERFKQILLEEKARLEAGLIPAGHQVVNRRLRARLSTADWVAEQTSGIDYLFFVRDLLSRIDSQWDALHQQLQDVLQTLVNRSGMLVNLTVDAATFETLQTPIESFLQKLPQTALTQPAWATPAPAAPEGLTIPSQVNYVAKGANLYAHGYTLHGSALVIRNYLGTTYLWDKVRIQGGAYGGMSSFDPLSGIYSFISYRDPNLLATLGVYDKTPEFLRNLTLSEAELHKAIIGTIGEFDTYLLPDAKGYTSLTRFLTGYDDARREQVRQQVLQTQPADFHAFADALQQVTQHGLVVVLGASETLQKANQFNLVKVL